MRMNEIVKEIDKLDINEKLHLVKEIWDGIAQGDAKLPITEIQERELDRRYNEYKSGKLKLHDWEDVHRDLRGK